MSVESLHPTFPETEVWKGKLLLRIVSLGGLECEFGSQERQEGPKTSRCGIPCTSNPSNLDLRSPSLSLAIVGHVHNDPSIFLLQHDLPPTTHQDAPLKL